MQTVFKISFLLYHISQELLLRKGNATKMDFSTQTVYSTNLFIFGNIFFLLTYNSLFTIEIGTFHLSTILIIIAVTFMVVGYLLRYWAMKTLGENFTRTLRVSKGQRVISHGPYALVRHPGYLANLFLWMGAHLGITHNWLILAVFFGLFYVVYKLRTDAEEKMLCDYFGDEYKQYQAKTVRMLPFW
jgi:protein-S-isoprenylcysteine O-methyltransferase Ste14